MFDQVNDTNELRSVTLKRSFLKFYLSVIVSTFLCIGIGVHLIIPHQTVLAKNKLHESDGITLIVGILFLLVGIYTAVFSVFSAAKIKADMEGITINKGKILRTEVESIALNGKHQSWFGYAGDAIVLQLRNGKVKYLYDLMYSNSSELKLFISQFVLEQDAVSAANYQLLDQSELGSEHYITFIGHQLLSMRGIIMWIPTIFLLYLIIFGWADPAISSRIIILIFLCFWFGVPSWHMNYFKLSPRFLIVKKQNLFWVKQVYLLSNIQEVIVEEDGRREKYLRIVTKDFQSKTYGAPCFWDDTWWKLKDKLEEYGVDVCDTCRDINPIY